MKYWVWFGDHYYAKAALGNFVGAFDTLEEAQATLETANQAVRSEKADWGYIAEVVDNVPTDNRWYTRRGKDDFSEWKPIDDNMGELSYGG